MSERKYNHVRLWFEARSADPERVGMMGAVELDQRQLAQIGTEADDDRALIRRMAAQLIEQVDAWYEAQGQEPNQ